jgi:hypothetical protein
VGNNAIKYFDYLGLNAPDGFKGFFDSSDQAGYYGSRLAAMLTKKADDIREYCGIICCKDNKFIISEPHGGTDRKYYIDEYKIKIFYPGKASCSPQQTTGLATVKCPYGWTLSAEYHSHPFSYEGTGGEDFSGTDPGTGYGDYPRVNRDSGVPLYLGTPKGKVKRLDKDKEGKDKDKKSHPGVEVPDTWGFENKWKNHKKDEDKK